METGRTSIASYRRIHQVIEPWVCRQPEALALQDKRGRVSYGELAVAIEDGAQRLRQLGVRPGDRVLMVAENCVALGVLVLAASAMDAWAVVVNARLSPREIDNFIEHSGARRVFYTSEISADALMHAGRNRSVEQCWPALGKLAVGPLNEGAHAEPASEDPKAQVAAMIYTSGTSGHPKGVMLTHANLLHVAELVWALRRLGPQNKAYGVLPMAHVVGLSSQLVGSLACGCALVLEDRYSAPALAKAMREEGITVLMGVPAMYAKLLDWMRSAGGSIGPHVLRLAGVAGSPLTQQLKQDVEAALGLTLHNNYGLTEMSPTVSQTLLHAPRTDCSVGMPVPGVEIRIVDSEGQPVEPGAVGELRVRGPNVMKGYYCNEALTREAVDAEGWFNTCDLARQEPDGALFIMGRTKELIIRSGFNVYPVEVEQVLNSHPDIVQSAVVGRQADGNEEVIAFVEAAANATISQDALERFLRERLSPYKLPAEIHFLTQLPVAPTGKVLKNALKEKAAVLGAGRRDPS
ncbi:AMP-binding protein [Cupriavidus basilensis]|uniref:AMP-binding protein n=1 Tax=Cupriavidus basilensis TaxID=68895 RepID=A0ABT6AQN6_9BURK|nr:AMP-binding protein [Cupriavidus basilensis]MDF3834934.1 AMP-binding protein [Cupriavidus basilensis]